MIILRLSFFISLWKLSESTENCYEKHLFSTKTPYSLVQNKDVTILKPGTSCNPVHINMIHRHGHRYPSIKDMKNMHEMAEIVNKASQLSDGVDLKLPWNVPYTFEQDKLLTSKGEEELFGIGKRIVSRFPDIFQTKYTPLNYTFQSTCKLRCTHSSIALASGLFDGKGHLGTGRYQPITLETHPCHSDRVLRFFDHCEKYVQRVGESEAGKREMKKFLKSKEVGKVLEKVKAKLGDGVNDLQSKHLKPMFITCAYQIAMHGGDFQSGFCSLFDEEDLATLEYLLDLKHFYVRSAGFKINYESACPLLADFVETMKQFVHNPTAGKLGVFRSAHAETIIPLFAILNVSLDAVQMRADNYELLKVRRFRAACLSPFSGNMYFVLYDCGTKDYKIQLYINEKLVQLPCCQSLHDCHFSTFLQYYEDLVDSCHFDHICEHRHHGKSEL